MLEINLGEIKKIRMLQYFIDAAYQIIEEEGIEGVTTRKVAQMAGYNSATIYNYFENRNQLIFFAAMRYISNYVRALPTYMNQSQDVLERFFLMWECFCKYSFDNPEIYYAIFTENIGEQPESIVRFYYSIFPEEMGTPPEELVPMLLESDLSKRSYLAIEPCIKKGYFTAEQAIEIDEMIMLMYHGMLSLKINNRLHYSVEEMVQQIMQYIRQLVINIVKQNHSE